MRCANIGASNVPDIALSTVILNLEFLTCEKARWQQVGIQQKKAEQRTPHFLSLNQDIVAWSQEVKCGLKYVIYIPRVLMEQKKAEPKLRMVFGKWVVLYRGMTKFGRVLF